MAKAKQELTNRTVQGPPPPSDALDRIIAIVADIAARAGLLDEHVIDLAVSTAAGHDEIARGDQAERKHSA